MSKSIKRDNFELQCADCFDILPQIKDRSVDLILTDLPYSKTACTWDIALPLDKLWKEYLRIGKPNTPFIFTATAPFNFKLYNSNPKLFRYDLVWEKPNGTNPMLVKKQPFKVHENVLVFYRKQPTYNPQMTYGHDTYSGFRDDSKYLGDIYTGGETGEHVPKSRHKENKDGSRYPRSIQKFPQDRSGHPTKKPVELMAWIIRSYSNPGDLVLDNCMGEGTTGVAAIQEGRKFIGIEIDNKFYERAVYDIHCTNEEIKGNCTE